MSRRFLLVGSIVALLVQACFNPLHCIGAADGCVADDGNWHRGDGDSCGWCEYRGSGNSAPVSDAPDGEDGGTATVGGRD